MTHSSIFEREPSKENPTLIERFPQLRNFSKIFCKFSLPV